MQSGVTKSDGEYWFGNPTAQARPIRFSNGKMAWDFKQVKMYLAQSLVHTAAIDALDYENNRDPSRMKRSRCASPRTDHSCPSTRGRI